MIEKLYISYRDFDDKNFDLYKSTAAEEEKYSTLLAQALSAHPQTDIERELLGDYIKTLRKINTCYREINEIRLIIQTFANSNDTIINISDLKEEAKKKAAIIYYSEQDLSVLEHSNGHLLQSVLERKFTNLESEEVVSDSIVDSKRNTPQKNNDYQDKKPTEQMNDKDYNKQMLRLLLPMVLSLTLPLLMLNAPVWLMVVVDLIILSPMLLWSLKLSIIVPYAYYIINPILYVWALIVTILGVQDFFAIAFYILMGLQTPKMIKNFIGTILIIYCFLTGKK